jgi:hypothetical protein
MLAMSVISQDPASLKRFAEAEVIHGRWAMLGVAGALAVELLGYGNWYDAPLWAINGGTATYFGVEVSEHCLDVREVLQLAGFRSALTRLRVSCCRVTSCFIRSASRCPST